MEDFRGASIGGGSLGAGLGAVSGAFNRLDSGDRLSPQSQYVPTKTAEVSPMNGVMVELAERLHRLEQAVNVIENKFSSVMRPVPPQGQSENAKRPQRVMSEFGNAIESVGDQIHGLTARLFSVAERCEL